MAAGIPPEQPAATFHANRVVEANAAARRWGIAPGLRRRESQARCPQVEVLDHDECRDARAFEPVVRAVERFSPSVEILRPGVCVFGARGPARYFGGEEALLAQVCGSVDVALESLGGLGEGPSVAGIADGPHAAVLAAGSSLLVPSGGTPEFLAPLPIDALGDVDFCDLLVRLGIRALGDLAALPLRDVVSRFGAKGEWAHRVARGREDRPLRPREPVPDLSVSTEIDPPAERVDVAMFVAKSLADELVSRMTELGLACEKLRITAATEHGEELSRVWRYSAAFTSPAIAERVRWQLEGWLGLPAADRPTGPISLLRLEPQDVGPAVGRQSGLWGRDADVSDRIRRSLARVQGILGHEGVVQPVLSGGRSPAEQVHLVPWGDPVEPARPGLPGAMPVRGPVIVETPPWPGRLPSPSPSWVLVEPSGARVTDATGAAVSVTGRLELSAPPARVCVRGRWAAVVSWAGPWPCDERWWDDGAHVRRARLQVETDAGEGYLLSVSGGAWSLEAVYD